MIVYHKKVLVFFINDHFDIQHTSSIEIRKSDGKGMSNHWSVRSTALLRRFANCPQRSLRRHQVDSLGFSAKNGDWNCEKKRFLTIFQYWFSSQEKPKSVQTVSKSYSGGKRCLAIGGRIFELTRTAQRAFIPEFTFLKEEFRKILAESLQFSV